MERVYYKISEVSKMLGVNASKLRYWEMVIPQLQPFKHEGKTRRFYTKENVEMLKRIQFLREEQNLPMEMVITMLKAEAAPLDTRIQAIEMLEQLKAELIEIRKNI